MSKNYRQYDCTVLNILEIIVSYIHYSTVAKVNCKTKLNIIDS